MKSDCKVPCSATFIKIKKGPQSHESSKDPHHILHIYFDDDVAITKISVDRFMIDEFLNFLGSNLGLWPGLGLFQLFEGSLIILIMLIKKRFPHIYRK